MVTVAVSEFTASCECEDFWRHQDQVPSVDEFQGRQQRSIFVQVNKLEAKYGSVLAEVLTQDKKSIRKYAVWLSRGETGTWLCKHILKVLQTQALMPDRKFKAVFWSEVGALLDLYPEAILTTVNGALVVGYGQV